jgi:hypothetical protein
METFWGNLSGDILEELMRGNCNHWVFDYMLEFMWHNNEADPDRYRLHVGIVQDPKYGNLHNHAWIEDSTTGEVLNRYKFKKNIEHTPKEDYYRLMHPRYIKRYSGREMLKKALKVGVNGLLENVPVKVLEAPKFKGPWDNGLRFKKKTRRG